MRPPIPPEHSRGGDGPPRAGAYSTYLAYFGTYEVKGEQVIHRLDSSLFPNWSGEEQARAIGSEGDDLVLRTPPMKLADGTTVVNELAWARGK